MSLSKVTPFPHLWVTVVLPCLLFSSRGVYGNSRFPVLQVFSKYLAHQNDGAKGNFSPNDSKRLLLPPQAQRSQGRKWDLQFNIYLDISV